MSPELYSLFDREIDILALVTVLILKVLYLMQLCLLSNAVYSLNCQWQFVYVGIDLILCQSLS